MVLLKICILKTCHSSVALIHVAKLSPPIKLGCCWTATLQHTQKEIISHELASHM